MECKKDQVYGQLKRAIMDGTLPPGSRLPTEKQLSLSLEVGQVTLRSALARLEAENLVERIRSKGTFVSNRSKRRIVMLIQPDGTENLETPSRYIAHGLEEAAEKRSVTLEICPESLFLSFSAGEREMIIRTHSISGIILETGHRKVAPQMICALKELGLPVVIPHGLSCDAEDTGFLVLRTDEKSSFKQAYEYLAGNGHRDIASLFLVLEGEDPDKFREFSREELSSFLSAPQFGNSRSLIAAVENRPELIGQQIRQWFALEAPPTAILCHSDRVAMRVYAVLHEMGLRIPEDVSIMGYSNFPGSQFLLPPLTTIDTRLKNCAALALDKLLETAPSSDFVFPQNEIFTPCSFIERSSVKNIRS